MLIGLISDTHILSPARRLPPQISKVFKGVDLILHAGDIWIPSVLDELETIAPVVAAWGDDDSEAQLLGDNRMMKRNASYLDDATLSDDSMIKENALHLDGTTLWLTHIKPRYGLINWDRELHPSVYNSENRPDVVVFGHTHSPAIEHYKNILLVSPGSPTMPNYIQKLGTVALLTLNAGQADIRIVPLE